MYEFKKLFQPIKIGKMELKNRIAFGEQAPQASHGYITQATEDFYVERARGGCGLVMVGGICPVSPAGAPSPWPGSMTIYMFPSWPGTGKTDM